MSTLADLIHADMAEDGARRNRYWKSSSLPVCERFNHRPKPKRSRRDKVLKKLMQINLRMLEVKENVSSSLLV